MNDKNESSLSMAVNTAHNIHGAIKTGKAISAALKGSAVGGPYGAAAGLALGMERHAGKAVLRRFGRIFCVGNILRITSNA